MRNRGVPAGWDGTKVCRNGDSLDRRSDRRFTGSSVGRVGPVRQAGHIGRSGGDGRFGIAVRAKEGGGEPGVLDGEVEEGEVDAAEGFKGFVVVADGVGSIGVALVLLETEEGDLLGAVEGAGEGRGEEARGVDGGAVDDGEEMGDDLGHGGGGASSGLEGEHGMAG